MGELAMRGTDRIQVVNHHQFNRYEVLQDMIARETKVICTVRVQPECVSIRCATYADFVMAKAVIRGRVSVPVVWSEPD